MSSITLSGKGASKGIVEGEALVVRETLSFLTDIDVNDGTLIRSGCDARGNSVAGKILVFPMGRGSTADPYAFYMLKKGGSGPKAVVNRVADPITVAGAIISHTPMVYKLDQNPVEVIASGDQVRVDGDRGVVTVMKRRTS